MGAGMPARTAMTIWPTQLAPLRLASSAIQAGRSRVAYAMASGLDPAQARREAMTGIGRAISYEASLLGSVELLILLGLALVLALALALGLKRDPYGEVARPGFAVLTSISPHHLH
jgi:hypothetical protein